MNNFCVLYKFPKPVAGVFERLAESFALPIVFSRADNQDALVDKMYLLEEIMCEPCGIFSDRPPKVMAWLQDQDGLYDLVAANYKVRKSVRWEGAWITIAANEEGCLKANDETIVAGVTLNSQEYAHVVLQLYESVKSFGFLVGNQRFLYPNFRRLNLVEPLAKRVANYRGISESSFKQNATMVCRLVKRDIALALPLLEGYFGHGHGGNDSGWSFVRNWTLLSNNTVDHNQFVKLLDNIENLLRRM